MGNGIASSNQMDTDSEFPEVMERRHEDQLDSLKRIRMHSLKHRFCQGDALQDSQAEIHTISSQPPVGRRRGLVAAHQDMYRPQNEPEYTRNSRRRGLVAAHDAMYKPKSRPTDRRRRPILASGHDEGIISLDHDLHAYDLHTIDSCYSESRSSSCSTIASTIASEEEDQWKEMLERAAIEEFLALY